MFPNIKAECGRKGWTMVDLSKELEVSYSTVKNWMKGRSDIPCSKLVRMSKLFGGVSIDYLLGLPPYDNEEVG